MRVRQVIKLVLILAGVYNFLASIQYIGIIVSMIITPDSAIVFSGVLINLLYIFGISYLLVFKSDLIIGFMKLDQQFEVTEIDFKQESFDVLLKTVIVLVGIWLIGTNLSGFLIDLFMQIRLSNAADAEYLRNSDIQSILTKVSTIVLGFILILNFNTLSKWIKRKNRLVE